ncbi:MAG TPA: hypothetical protein VEV44_17155 [Pseudoneobacillus sp.]|nr:hypothetical protein [Pseudoneobacillus sp.]
MYLSLAFVYLPLLVALISTGAINPSSFIDPKLLYYTPGLWEKSGTSFWSAFLFETPFALMRGFSWYILVLAIALFLIFSLRSRLQYIKTRKC